MRIPLATLALVVALAGHAAAQVPASALSAGQTDLWAQQQMQRQQALDQSRQAFVQEQRAQTDQALAGLDAARRGDPAPIQPVTPSYSAAWAARADSLLRLGEEIAARPVYLLPAPRTR